MKLQINSLQALERLIGGDTEIEVEVRKNIVQDFARKHLKPIAGDVIKPMIDAATKACQREACDALAQALGTFRKGTYSYTTETFALRPEIARELRAEASREVASAIKNAVAEIRQEYTDAAIQRAVDRQVNAQIQDEIRVKVAARLKQISASL